MKKSPVALACVLLFAATASCAMSLGRNRGAVLIGRPLDVVVQATLEAQDDVNNLCLEADVFYSDNRLAQGRVRVAAEKAGSDAIIRIRSDLPIDEPVVSIYLRAGCAQRTERRYVLLADMASDAAGGAAVPPTALIVPPRAATPPAADAGTPAATATAPASRPARPARQPATASTATDPVVVRAPVATAPTRAERAANVKAAAAAKNTKARLKLEPLDLTIERDPQLRASPEMLSVPAATDQERSVASALFRALSARPEDLVKDAEKLQALEASLRDLRSQTLKNQQAIADLDAQLKKAQAERYANLLVYGLGLLLLLALVAIGWLWRRRAQGEVEGDELPWWRKNRQADKGWGDSLLDAGPAAPAHGGSLPAALRASGKPGAGAAALDLDLGFDHPDDIEVQHMSGHGARHSQPPQTDFAPSSLGGGSPRAVKAEELFDVQQQADFFVSLGQHEQAIEVLRSHILDNGPTSALVYLDLFNLYHQLDRRADYDALRGEFNQLFNARMPEFDAYTVKSPGLESYDAAMGRIEALWPSPKVLEVIEESIFRKPDANARAFDLEAYRELLLLYAVAREIISPEDNKNDSLLSFDLPDSTLGGMEGKTVKFMATAIQPLSASVGEDGYGETRPMSISVSPRPSSRLGLDIDLDELAPPEPAAAPAQAEPESDSQFFAQFVASLPDSGTATEAPPSANRGDDPGNLIDFDGFDEPPTRKP